jgi:O-antigen ligase
MGVAILTGRRKALLEVVVFATTYAVLWVIFQRAAMKLGIALAIVGLVGVLVLEPQANDLPNYVESPSAYDVYVARSKTVFQDAPSRFVELGIAPVTWAYDSFGFFGAGLGVGTQGTQYFGGGGDMAGAAEGGLGKITLELGVPGLLLMVWLVLSIFLRIWEIMKSAARASPRLARLSFGLFSFLVANVAGFSVATQAYGDPFILLMMSWTLGFLLAIPFALEREDKARSSAISDKSKVWGDVQTAH